MVDRVCDMPLLTCKVCGCHFFSKYDLNRHRMNPKIHIDLWYARAKEKEEEIAEKKKVVKREKISKFF